MKSLPPTVCIQCYCPGEYIGSCNYSPHDLHCAFSITYDEVEASSQQHYPGYVLVYPHLFHLRDVQPPPTITSTIPTTLTALPCLSNWNANDRFWRKALHTVIQPTHYILHLIYTMKSVIFRGN